MNGIQTAAVQFAEFLRSGTTGPRESAPAESVSKWNRIGKIDEVTPSTRRPHAEDVISRLLRTRTGQSVISDLVTLLRMEDGGRSQVLISFMDRQEFPDRSHAEAAGYMQEELPGEPAYHLFVQWEVDARPTELDTLRNAISKEAHTTCHELLHVWFIHKYPNDGFGHDTSAFDSRLSAVTRELAKLEAP